MEKKITNNMEKILVSTKQSQSNSGSDAPGTSLTQLLHADYLQQNRKLMIRKNDCQHDD